MDELESKLSCWQSYLVQVFNELSRHVSLDEVLNQAPGAAASVSSAVGGAGNNGNNNGENAMNMDQTTRSSA